MDIRDSQHIDSMFHAIDQFSMVTSQELARALALYIKVSNDQGLVKTTSLAYLSNYDGHTFHKKFAKQFDTISLIFTHNGICGKDVREIFRRVALREHRLPKNIREMEHLKGLVVEELHDLVKRRSLSNKRNKLVSRFKVAVKHYLNMTYELGFNEPSACVKFLAENHKIDKYIMAGDFAVLLLPFLPEIEETIRKNYEHYEMQDAWENLKGRYFNHKAEYANLATEIKSTFNRTISNFSQYFDDLYTNTYYKMMLSRRQK